MIVYSHLLVAEAGRIQYAPGEGSRSKDADTRHPPTLASTPLSHEAMAGMTTERLLPRSFDTPLPIDAVLDELARTLAAGNAAVLVAPPGAGKTTRVPLALLDAPWLGDKKIIMLEPRRIAARASAERMAKTLGEPVGETVGYRVRFGSKISRATRIEVVTEGIFSRQILDDPELSGVAAVLFDEFHERSLDADLGLALARDAQTGLREDLRILVMSATLDGARVAKLLGDAPVVASEGRAFPVETRYLGRKADAPLERQMADAIATALRADPGSVLAFLPGAAEIRRTQNFLGERVHDAAHRNRAAVRRARCRRAGSRDRAGAEGPAQGGAGDLDRGDLADHRGRAHRGRFRRGAGAALRAGYRADAAGNRARLARRGRSAPRPRRPHRARRLLPAVGRAADRVACGLYPAGNSQRRSVVAGARSRAMGRQRSRDTGVSRSAAGARAEGGAKPAARTRRARRRWPDHGRGQQPARAGAAAAAGAHDRGFASSRRRRGGRRDRRDPHRARPRRRQRRSRIPARPIPPRPLATRQQRPQPGAALGVRRWLPSLRERGSAAQRSWTPRSRKGEGNYPPA